MQAHLAPSETPSLHFTQENLKVIFKNSSIHLALNCIFSLRDALLEPDGSKNWRTVSSLLLTIWNILELGQDINSDHLM